MSEAKIGLSTLLSLTFLLVVQSTLNSQAISDESSRAHVAESLPDGTSRPIRPPEIKFLLGDTSDALPDYYSNRIDRDDGRKYRRILLQLGKDQELQDKIVISAKQKAVLKEAHEAVDRTFAELEELRLAQLEEYTRNGRKGEAFETQTWERKRLQDEAYERYRNVVEEVLRDDQLRRIRLRSSGYALAKNLPKSIPRFVRAAFLIKQLDLPAAESKELERKILEASIKFAKDVKKAELAAMKKMVESYPVRLQKQVAEVLHLDTLENELQRQYPDSQKNGF